MNIQKYLLLLCLAVCIIGCKQPAKEPPGAILPPVETFTGLIRYDHGFCSFRDCASPGLYLICDSTKTLVALHKKACQPAQCPDETVFAVVKGRLFQGEDTKRDPGTLAIIGIDSLIGKNWTNCCIPYEYWCTGTEPFWNLQVSKAEKSLFFKNISEETGKTFDWAPPVVTGNTVTYIVKNRENTAETMTVIITKAPCSDGMSEMQFNYSSTIKLGSQTWHGCAVKWGEALPKSE